MNHTPETRDPKSLKRHALHKAHVPAPDKKSPEWGAFLETVRNDGRIRNRIKITKDGLVMDGWWRREAAVDLQLEEVPVEVGDEGEAALLIVETLTARKQMTRGAAVYLALGLLPEYATAAEARRLKNKAGQRSTLEKPINPKVASTGHPEDGSRRYLAERWGCAKATVDQAAIVRDTLHNPKVFSEWAKKLDAVLPKGGEAQLQAQIRAEMEPLLFNGEKSLWKILPAVAGRLSTVDKPKTVQMELVFGEKVDALFDLAHMPKHAAAQAVIEEKLSDQDDIESLERIVKLGTGMAEAAQARIVQLKKTKAA